MCWSKGVSVRVFTAASDWRDMINLLLCAHLVGKTDPLMNGAGKAFSSFCRSIVRPPHVAGYCGRL